MQVDSVSFSLDPNSGERKGLSGSCLWNEPDPDLLPNTNINAEIKKDGKKMSSV